MGSVYRWSETGKVCSGDKIMEVEINNVNDVKASTKWQFWDSSGMMMQYFLILQWILIACMCCCSCMFAGSKKQE